MYKLSIEFLGIRHSQDCRNGGFRVRETGWCTLAGECHINASKCKLYVVKSHRMAFVCVTNARDHCSSGHWQDDAEYDDISIIDNSLSTGLSENNKPYVQKLQTPEPRYQLK